MKKTLLLVMIVLLPSLAFAQGTFLRISAVYGPVEVRPASSTTFAPLNASVRMVQIGDEIRTGPGATVTLEMEDGSYMVVSENSAFTVQDFWSGGVRHIMNMVVGKVRFYIQRLGGRPSPYRVGTPTALIAVRGTIFEVTVDAAQYTEVRCFEGRVTVESAGLSDREVILDGGRKTLVRPGEYPMAPVGNDEALLRNRVIRVVKKGPADQDPNVGNVPSLDALLRDNDRLNRSTDPLQGGSSTDSNVSRTKPTLNFPE
jgi:hypothetical protein